MALMPLNWQACRLLGLFAPDLINGSPASRALGISLRHDQLEQQLSQADQQRRRVLEAVLAEALVEPEKTFEVAYA